MKSHGTLLKQKRKSKYQKVPLWIKREIQRGTFRVDDHGEIWNYQYKDANLAWNLFAWKQIKKWIN
jgi:hypothetical protein